MQDLVRFISGGQRDLLPFPPIERYLRAYPRIEQRKAVVIDIGDIVGSVGRYQDFNRSFLPRNQAIMERWAMVHQGVSDQAGLPPIEVFKVGGVYFVADGNHRVSTARACGFREIEAYVTEYPVDPGLEPGDSLDEALAKAGRAVFLQQAGLEGQVADTDIRLTWAGGYRQLADHVQVQRLLMEDAEPGREVTHAEAALAWYHGSYLPVAAAIRQQRLLDAFPGRTEGDLYVWIWGLLERLRSLFGEEIDAEEGAALLGLRQEMAPGGLAGWLRRLRGRPEDEIPDWVETLTE